MPLVPIRQGEIKINEEDVEIESTSIGGIKRLYGQSKRFVIFLLFCWLVLIADAIVNPTSLARERLAFATVFVVLLVSFNFVAREFWDSIATASTISCADINWVEYTTESWLRPKLRIIVTDGDSTGVRTVRLSLRRHGGDQQLERAIQAFEDAGITVTSIEDRSDEDR